MSTQAVAKFLIMAVYNTDKNNSKQNPEVWRQIYLSVCPFSSIKWVCHGLLRSLVMSGSSYLIIYSQASKLLKYLIVEKGADLHAGIASLDNFPDRPAFKECKAIHSKLKYASGKFTLKQVHLVLWHCW